MTLRFDLYYSFRSPYSYLATPQIAALRQRWDLECDVKVVRPIAVRIPGFFEQVNPLWPPYLMRDTMRISQRLDIPYGWPRPDPIVMNSRTEVATEQPHITRISRLGVAAVEAGRGLEFLVEAGRIIWSGAVQGWNDGDHIAAALKAAGLDPEAIEAKIADEDERIDALIAANEEAQVKAGHWGVPLLVFQGEPFFGQDRLEDLVWRMRQNGLEERSEA
ncbi:MAG TPA: DsbA family protein [Caulobacteraceae bacterium]|jgi:2-hydroxychromene-2-carboxylate isomerase|nr:DsbA family protein [Caulobacteraceae bacterium]